MCGFGVDVDGCELFVEGDVSFGFEGFSCCEADCRAEAFVELACSAFEWELELVVWSPAVVVESEDDVSDCSLVVEYGDAFADPLFVHHFWRVCPDFEVVWSHEVFGDSRAEDGVDELAEVFGVFVVFDWGVG